MSDRAYATDERYRGKDNSGKPKTEYITRISGMDDAALLKETESKIWLSAYAGNNPRSDYHWHVDVCYDEWKHRGKLDQYDVAYKTASRKAGVS